MRSHKRWTRIEDELVRIAYIDAGPRRIAMAIGRTENAVVARAKLLGATKRHRRWTMADERALSEMQGYSSAREIADALNRTECAVYAHLSAMRRRVNEINVGR